VPGAAAAGAEVPVRCGRQWLIGLLQHMGVLLTMIQTVGTPMIVSVFLPNGVMCHGGCRSQQLQDEAAAAVVGV
jgi:hypothetical protein